MSFKMISSEHRERIINWISYSLRSASELEGGPNLKQGKKSLFLEKRKDSIVSLKISSWLIILISIFL